jgi:dipeptidyl aminopeptidase/acylaminoacyl peptidase
MKLHLVVAALCAAAMSLCPAYPQSHSFSVKDDIAMVRFSDPRPDPATPGSDTVRSSPDGRHFAFVTTRGRLESDQIESNIYVFDRKALSAFAKGITLRAPLPRKIATVVSFPHREEANAYAPVIKDLRWSPNLRRLYFKGEARNGNYQLYVANIDGSGFYPLTSSEESLGRYDVLSNRIVYTASRPHPDPDVQANTINRDAQVITGRGIIDVLFPGQIRTIEPETFGMSVLRRIGDRWTRNDLPLYSVREIPYLSFLFPFALSPSGDKLIAVTPVETIPDAWEDYEPVSGFEHRRFRAGDPRSASDALINRPEEYSLIDTTTGATTPLVNTPDARVLAYLDNNRLAWAPDGRRVLVTNTFLPFTGKNKEERVRRKAPCAVASVDLPSHAAQCLFFEDSDPIRHSRHVLDVSFGENDNEAIVLSRDGPNNYALQRYSFRNGLWNPGSLTAVDVGTDRLRATNSVRQDIRVVVRQSLNDPPSLWAVNALTGKERPLWNPNPQFQHIRFGQATLYRWKDKTGYEWSSVLVKPVDYVAGRRYPLVIQMYSFADGLFLTDGLYPTAFAARHLASAGFVVLQVKRRPGKLSLTEPDEQLEGYRSAIESLSKTGLIDPKRVGVVGFSWTCWYVINALIKAPKMFAAATIADGLDNSYMQYLLTADSPDIQSQMTTIYGTSPFGAGLQRWIAHAPGFNLDKVRTPVRIEAINPASVLQEWELYASLHLQNKPVDFIYFPHGTHIHQKPLERLESQQGDVDWFRFWLEGYEDPDPSKRAQYARWHLLREEAHQRLEPIS